MPDASDGRFLVLHGLRLRGFGEPPAIADAVGLDIATVEEQLAKLKVEELVLRRDGRLAGWALTPAGRAEQQRLAADDATDAVRDAYERFRALNPVLLTVCTDWQVRGDVPNDHTDETYDAAVVARLHDVHERVTPILTDLAAERVRFAPFAGRFAAALAHVDAGEVQWITKPLIDSYHTVWFELHEDLLSTLGIERSQEGES